MTEEQPKAWVKKHTQAVGLMIPPFAGKRFLGFRYLGERCLIVGVLFTLLCLWDFGWCTDLASHFRVQYACLFAVGLLGVIIRKKPGWVLLGVWACG